MLWLMLISARLSGYGCFGWWVFGSGCSGLMFWVVLGGIIQILVALGGWLSGYGCLGLWVVGSG